MDVAAPIVSSRSGPRSFPVSARRSRAIVLRRLDDGATRDSVDDLDEQARTESLRDRVRPPRSSRPAGIGRVAVASIGPASSSVTTRMIVTPVIASPAMTARWIGAAPRYFGSSDACTLIMPSARDTPGARRAESGRRRRRRQGRRRSAAMLARNACSRSFRGCRTGMPASSATALVGVGATAVRAPSGDRAATRAPRRRGAKRSSLAASGPQTPASRRRRSAARSLPSSGSFQLMDLPDDQVALDSAQAIDEERAIEMIHLVLKRPREQVAVPRSSVRRPSRSRPARPRAPDGRPSH